MSAAGVALTLLAGSAGPGSAQPRAAIRDARALGLTVMVKPHVWVPESWAGTVAPRSEDGWRTWFESYRAALATIAAVAAEERADALSIGPELEKKTGRPEWIERPS